MASNMLTLQVESLLFNAHVSVQIIHYKYLFLLTHPIIYLNFVCFDIFSNEKRRTEGEISSFKSRYRSRKYITKQTQAVALRFMNVRLGNNKTIN